MKEFKEYNFGDYSGLREYKRDPGFFVDSFVEPETFSLKTLRNNHHFIVVGRKGTGKSSCCLALSHKMNLQNYKSTFYNFSDDLTRSDIRDAVQTQALNLSDISTKKLFDSIVEFYDFRDLWIRKLLHTLSTQLAERGISSEFVNFSQSVKLSEESIAEGVGRGLSIPIPTVNIPKSIGKLFDGFGGKNSIPLKEYNNICLKLLSEYHKDERNFFFFDELNISHSKSDSSEYNTLLALIRDIVRASAHLNDYFVEAGLDIHVICCLRPEVRSRLIEKDDELSKTIDSNAVDLSWPTTVRPDNPLIGLLKKKIISAGASQIQAFSIVPDEVKDMDSPRNIKFEMYFLNLTWYRPRDVIRILKCYQSTNGNRQTLFSEGHDQIRFLKEYARVSKQDCFAELEVKYTGSLLQEAIGRIRRPSFYNFEDLRGHLDVLSNRIDVDEQIQDMFDAGVIANHQRDGNDFQIYAAYRNDSGLNPDLRILVHRGLRMSLQLSIADDLNV